MKSHPHHSFDPMAHEAELVALIGCIASASTLDARGLLKLVNRHPKSDGRVFTKSEILRGIRMFGPRWGWDERALEQKVRTKPVRTQSGVEPVTVLTKPFFCPGECIFCPNDVRMPKSYLFMEPGAQRAFHHRFDPAMQVRARLWALFQNGHPVDKVELIVLGGTWSAYPKTYQLWFVEECLRAMNEWDPKSAFLDTKSEPQENGAPTLEHVREAQRKNEVASARCVGLSIETRPDFIDPEALVWLRRLGVTKVQLGVQSLDDEILSANARGHDVATVHRAFWLLRQAGFKIQAHFMLNLLGATADRDAANFSLLFSDARVRPDELKLYPCSLVSTAPLMREFEAGRYRPYAEEELLSLVATCLAAVPRYCRATRVIRDFPAHDIVAGCKTNNLREHAERRVRTDGRTLVEIRSREIRDDRGRHDPPILKSTEYATSVGTEVFLEFVTEQDRILGFLRLTLPDAPSFVAELGHAAVIREVHVYGRAARVSDHFGDIVQHTGLGRALILEARRICAQRGYRAVAVISAIGTREYYRKLGFRDGELYQHIDSLAGVP